MPGVVLTILTVIAMKKDNDYYRSTAILVPSAIVRLFPLIPLFFISSDLLATGASPPPNAGRISSHPNAAGISSHPNAAGISSHPSATGISSHPNAAGISSHPNAAGISSNPNATGISSHPDAIGISSHANAAGLVNKKVQWSDVPALVQKTINENAGGGEIQEIGKESKLIGGRIMPIYEAGLRKADGSKIEIKVDEDGNLIEIGKD